MHTRSKFGAILLKTKINSTIGTSWCSYIESQTLVVSSFFLLFFRIINVTLATGTQVKLQVQPFLYSQLTSTGKSFTYINLKVQLDKM